MKEKRSIVEDIISETLEITAPVVLIENEYGQDEADLERDGDFMRLPNGIENRVVAAANQYIDQNKSNDEEKHELREIASSLTKMGLKTQNDGSSISLGCVRYFHGSKISQVGEQMLKEMYGITKKTIQLDSGIVF